MDNNYVFDWNDEINNENAFVLLPEGDYEFTVTNFERAHFDGSEKLPACKKAIVTFTITGAQDTTTVTEHFLLCSQLEWKISALFLSVGMKKHGEPLHMNWSALPGKKGRCRIFVDNYKKDGTERQSNKIKKFYAYDEDVNIVQPVAAKQPVQQGGWQAGKF